MPSPPVCGDGLFVCGDASQIANQACDDGNNRTDDGCSDKWTVEAGFGCNSASEPSFCRRPTTIHVDSRSNYSESGLCGSTQDSACTTIASINTSQLVPGDVIELRRRGMVSPYNLTAAFTIKTLNDISIRSAGAPAFAEPEGGSGGGEAAVKQLAVLDGQGSSPCMVLDGASNIRVEGLRFQNCRSDHGAGAYVKGASKGASFVGCEFVANVAAVKGGAISIAEGSSANFFGCKFWENEAGGDGGVAKVSDSRAIFTDCSMSNNTAGHSGGVASVNQDSSASFSDCSLSNNTAGVNGGVAILQDQSNASFLRSDLSLNSAKMNGGAVSASTNSLLEMRDSIISSNTVSDTKSKGGAIFLDSSARADISDTTFDGNQALGQGSEGGCLYAKGTGGAVGSRTSIVRGGNMLNSRVPFGSGGALSISDGATLFMEGVSLKSNKAGIQGGHVFAEISAQVIIANSSAQDGEAGSGGGCIFSNAARVSLHVTDMIFNCGSTFGLAGGGIKNPISWRSGCDSKECDSKPCSRGSYYRSHNAGCFLAAPGYFSVGGEVADVQDHGERCPAGSHASVEGASECTVCSSGFFSIGTTSAAAAVDCQRCARGQFGRANNQSLCEACSEGMYSGDESSTVCKACGEGQIAASKKQIVCSPCPAGKASVDETGHLSKSICTPCGEGSFSGIGQPQCSPCTAGSVAAQGLPSCTICGAGSMPSETKSACVECEDDKYNDAAGSKTCKPVPSGFFALSKATLPNLCPAGQFSFYDRENPRFDKSSVKNCTTCPSIIDPISNKRLSHSTICENGAVSLEKLLLAVNNRSVYWNATRPDGSPPKIYGCTLAEMENSCTVIAKPIGKPNFDGLAEILGGVAVPRCLNNRTGLFCAACKPPMKQVGLSCQLCDDVAAWNVVQLVFGPLLLLLAFDLMLIRWTGVQKVDFFGFKMRFVPERDSNPGPVMRSLSFDWLQCIGMLSQFVIDWPSEAQQVLTATRQASSFGILGSSCLIQLNYGDGLIFSALYFVMPVLAFVIYVLVRYSVSRSSGQGFREWLSCNGYHRSVVAVFKSIFVVTFPGLAHTGLSHFRCVHADGGKYIREDVSQMCEGMVYEAQTFWAVLALVQVYSFPLVLTAVLERHVVPQGQKESTAQSRTLPPDLAKITLNCVNHIMALNRGLDTNAAAVSISRFLTQLAAQMRNGEVELAEYVITKRLNKAPADLEAGAQAAPHEQVALAMRDEGRALSRGDLVSFVMCKRQDAGAASSRPHHPDVVCRSEGTLQIDVEWYLLNRVHPAVSCLFPSPLAAVCLGLRESELVEPLQQFSLIVSPEDIKASFARTHMPCSSPDVKSWTSAAESRHASLVFEAYYSAWTRNFNTWAWFWEPLRLMRKALFATSAILIQKRDSSVFAAVSLMMLSVSFTAFIQPYRLHWINVVDCIGQLILIICLQLGTTYCGSDSLPSSRQAAGIVVISMVAAWALVLLLLTVAHAEIQKHLGKLTKSCCNRCARKKKTAVHEWDSSVSQKNRARRRFARQKSRKKTFSIHELKELDSSSNASVVTNPHNTAGRVPPPSFLPPAPVLDAGGRGRVDPSGSGELTAADISAFLQLPDPYASLRNTSVAVFTEEDGWMYSSTADGSDGMTAADPEFPALPESIFFISLDDDQYPVDRITFGKMLDANMTQQLLTLDVTVWWSGLKDWTSLRSAVNEAKFGAFCHMATANSGGAGEEGSLQGEDSVAFLPPADDTEVAEVADEPDSSGVNSFADILLSAASPVPETMFYADVVSGENVRVHTSEFVAMVSSGQFGDAAFDSSALSSSGRAAAAAAVEVWWKGLSDWMPLAAALEKVVQGLADGDAADRTQTQGEGWEEAEGAARSEYDLPDDEDADENCPQINPAPARRRSVVHQTDDGDAYFELMDEKGVLTGETVWEDPEPEAAGMV